MGDDNLPGDIVILVDHGARKLWFRLSCAISIKNCRDQPASVYGMCFQLVIRVTVTAPQPRRMCVS